MSHMCARLISVDTEMEFIVRWSITVLQQTAPINTNSRVFINVQKGSDRQQLSKWPHESMHDPSPTWPDPESVNMEKVWRGFTVERVSEPARDCLNVPLGLSLTGQAKDRVRISGFPRRSKLTSTHSAIVTEPPRSNLRPHGPALRQTLRLELTVLLLPLLLELFLFP